MNIPNLSIVLKAPEMNCFFYHYGEPGPFGGFWLSGVRKTSHLNPEEILL